MLKIIISILFIFLTSVQASEKISIKYPLTSINTERDEFKLSVLKLILDNANIKYNIESSTNIYSQARAVKELKKGKEINLFWMGTSKEVEEELIPIRFPLYRGLVGHRVFIINKNDQMLFNNIKTLEQLQKLKGAQGIGWSDIALLEASGLNQYVTKYENIFNMINKGGRVDYFSRGINEIYSEISLRKEKLSNLTVEKNIVLTYPFAMFFFVSPKDKNLAEVLNASFRKAYEDRVFEKFFYTHPIIKKSIEKSNLNNRIRIDIKNPFLSEETLNIDNRYWHSKFNKEL